MSPPARLGRYPVRRRLGAGAFATVWLAYDEHLDSPVAIKVLADNWTEDHHVRQRFLEEGRFLRKVESPHVVTVYDAGELADGRPYLVMSYADQGTLADRLDLAPLTRAQAVHVVGQVGDGLSALHHRGVLHRDVKPANVLFRTVEQHGRTRVCAMLGDLGLGKAMDMSSRLTMIGGTPSFVAPEQARGERLDARADQFSLAALTYLLLAGRAPYGHASLSAAADPPPPPPLDAGLPAGVDAVVRRALSKDREDRYPDVAAYVSALERAMAELDSPGPAGTRGPAGTPDAGPDAAPDFWIPVDPDLTQAAPRPAPTQPEGALPPLPSVPRRRRRGSWAAAAVAVLLAGGGAGWVLEGALTDEHTLQDASGTISVTVPEAWTASVATAQWTPPESQVDFPSVSAGTSRSWNGSTDPESGVFVGILAGDELPTRVPQHPECDSARPPVTDEQDGDASLTVFFTGCAGPDVTVERVVQATGNQLLWVQVRSHDRGTANRVLDSVELHGM